VADQPRAVAYRDLLSDDGTLLRAWTNDPDGTIAGPTVLLCNGLATSPYSWPAFLSPGCGVRVVSWSHRGTAGSDRPLDPESVSVRHFVEDALSVMDHFGLSRPVVAGWSIGVNIMFELAAEHPERVSGLFAVAGAPGDTFSTMLEPLRLPRAAARLLTSGASRALRLTGAALTPLTSRLRVSPRMFELFGRAGLAPSGADPEMAARALQNFLSTPTEWYFHLALRTAEHSNIAMRRIRVPVVFVAGSRDLIAGSRHMAEVAARLPDATYVELRGSHFLPIEQPEVVHGLLLDLLRRVDAGSSISP
jgi:pimeloyl-ACP methyl ester carboxylesterase